MTTVWSAGVLGGDAGWRRFPGETAVGAGARGRRRAALLPRRLPACGWAPLTGCAVVALASVQGAPLVGSRRMVAACREGGGDGREAGRIWHPGVEGWCLCPALPACPGRPSAPSATAPVAMSGKRTPCSTPTAA